MLKTIPKEKTRSRTMSQIPEFSGGSTSQILFKADRSSLKTPEAPNKVRVVGRAPDQEMIFAVGPADGWSDEMRKGAGSILSFGKITLPHELARVVLLEQLYRGFTILKGHPYHGGH